MKLWKILFGGKKQKDTFSWVEIGWLFVWILILGYSRYKLERHFFSIYNFELRITEYFIVGFIAIFLFNFVFNLWNELQIQKIRKGHSWICYAYYIFILNPIISSCLWIIDFWMTDPYWFMWERFFLITAINCFAVLTLIVLNFFIKAKKISHNLRFAAGAVGEEQDELKFNYSAKNISDGLGKLDEYVSVVALCGDSGFGKSSYARMIIEKVDLDKTLYTFISLTETNEAKDFSKLFAERWLQTLKERYPIANYLFPLSLMQSVLREFGNDFLATAASFVFFLNKPIRRTEAKFFDKFYIKNQKHSMASENVTKLFGGIKNIKEDMWIIMIDEIERAQFDEIYRVIEIIERFKNEGRNGLPIKIIFLLCVSDNVLRALLSEYKDKDSRAFLINSFFYDNPKNITNRIHLPFVEYGVKAKYIIKQISDINKEKMLGIDRDIEDVYPDTSLDPTLDFFEDQKKTISFLLGKFHLLSPREITRCLQNLKFIYDVFANKAGKSQIRSIRFADLLAMEYAKIKYPYLIEFFEKTIDLLISNKDESLSTNMLNYHLEREKFQEKKIRLVNWVENVAGVKIQEQNKDDVEKIIGLISYSYFDFLQGKDNGIKKIGLYVNSLASPTNLYNYLIVLRNEIETPFDRYNQLYEKQKNKKINFEKLSLENLIGYSKFIANIDESSVRNHSELLEEITKRIIEEKVKILYRNVDDTPYDSLIYSFVFQLAVTINKDLKSHEKPSKELKSAYLQLKKVLLSENVTTAAKYIILNSLVNDTGETGTEIYRLFKKSFLKIKKYWECEVKLIIEKVFEEADKKYNIDEKIIYKNEENFFYVMYQGWSGQANQTVEIEKIRKTARRELEKYPDALALYWKQYPKDENWTNYDDMTKKLPIEYILKHATNFELYMPLTDLIKISKLNKIVSKEIKWKINFWEKIAEDDRYKDVAKIKDDVKTLKAVLKTKGLIT